MGLVDLLTPDVTCFRSQNCQMRRRTDPAGRAYRPRIAGLKGEEGREKERRGREKGNGRDGRGGVGERYWRDKGEERKGRRKWR